ncbi:hypothetical protein DS742_25370 [Lacrimispora amygdalina]|uniref:Uncharacterized protein n=1 Tax=Lacrimispora amygdalina TaxID=253257 RepID=A0A3E2N533_9FIRM|nr:hypothetical protein [Clostridium indicum]RFZ76107.1 hypothetical protein DS742_25370 [Clostridium indicum]
MNIDKWMGSYKIRAFQWIDGKRIYFNVQYYAPGQSIQKPPVWDKTIYVTDDAAGRRIVCDFTQSLVDYVARMQIPSGTEVILTAQVTASGAGCIF